MVDDVLFSTGKVEWGTPPELYQRLNQRYCFNYDPAASHLNHLTALYSTLEGTFHTATKISDLDGLDSIWTDLRVFLNPPYGRGIIGWVRKAAESDCLVVALLPVRTDTAWWQDWVAPYADIEYIRGRLRFVGAQGSAPFPSAIARYR